VIVFSCIVCSAKLVVLLWCLLLRCVSLMVGSSSRVSAKFLWLWLILL